MKKVARTAVIHGTGPSDLNPKSEDEGGRWEEEKKKTKKKKKKKKTGKK
jgi:predicted neutral ceramidase superfamily lipid hydrolase